MNETDRLELGPDAAWALLAENENLDNFGAWLEWREIPRGKRMADLYGFGEIHA